MATLSVKKDETGRSPAEVNPSVLVAILNWNRPIETIACLESVLRLRYPKFTTLLIDNGSQPEGFDPIMSWAAAAGVAIESIAGEATGPPDGELSRVSLMRLHGNLGYAGGNNRGLATALRCGYDWTLVLNNDTVVPADLLDRLVASGGDAPDIGIVGCRVLPLGQSGGPAYEGGQLMYGFGVYALRRWHGRRGVVSVNFVPGCSLLVRTDMVRQIGLFDERFFLYSEDIDLSYRALRAGWRLVVNLETHVEHRLSSSLGGRRSAAYYYYVTRNTSFFIRDRLSGVVRACSAVCFVGQSAGRCAVWAVERRWHLVRAVIRGFGDFLEGKTGPVLGLLDG